MKAFLSLFLSLSLFAQAQQTSSPYDNDPFWGNTGPTGGGNFDVNDQNKWFNNAQVLSSLSGSGADPLNPGVGGVNEPDPTSNIPDVLSDPTLDPTGTLYGDWSGNNNPSIIRPTDSIWTKFIRYTGVLTKDYGRIIYNLRQSSGYDSDDAIANEIISSAANRAGAFGATGAIITSLIKRRTDPTGGDPTMGYGYGDFLAMLGIPAEAAALMTLQMGTVLQLAALYGELPLDADDRTDLVSIPFAISLLTTATNKAVTRTLLTAATKHLVVNMATKHAAKAVGAKVAAESAASVIGLSMAAQAAMNTASVASTGWFSRFVSFSIPIAVIAAKALTAYAINRTTTYILGKKAKSIYSKMALTRKAKTILAIKSNTKAKHSLWLVLTKQVRPTMVADDWKRYAAVIDSAMPLVRNERWDELKAMTGDYNKRLLNVENQIQTSQLNLIDEYLLSLGKDFDVDSKLYLVQLVMAGMYMKGGLDNHDIQVIDRMAIALRLYPPPKAEVKRLPANDPLRDAMGRYLQLRKQMEEAVTTAESVRADSLTKNKKTKQVIAHRGRSGQIIFEDFYATKSIVGACEEVAKNGKNKGDDCVANVVIEKKDSKEETEKDPLNPSK